MKIYLRVHKDYAQYVVHLWSKHIKEQIIETVNAMCDYSEGYIGYGDYFPTFWQEDIHCRFSHATIAAMCSPLYLIWLRFTMSVVVLSQKQKGLDSMQGVQPFLRLCVGRSSQLQLSAEH